MVRWLLIGVLGAGMPLAPGCDTGDDVADAVDDVDHAGDGNWEDGDALEIRDHAE